MTREQRDSATFNGQIGTSTNEVLEVEVGRAEDVAVFVDSGSTDGAPASYDLTVRCYNNEVDDFQQLDTFSASTALSHELSAYGSRMEFEFDNQSGAAADYRIVVKSYRLID